MATIIVSMSPRGPPKASARDRYEQLVELSPSAKYVFSTLEHHGTCSQAELAEETLLPKRTVQYALNQLDEEGLVEKRIDASDARYREYSATAVTPPGDDRVDE